jgi:hypothetical protein
MYFFVFLLVLELYVYVLNFILFMFKFLSSREKRKLWDKKGRREKVVDLPHSNNKKDNFGVNWFYLMK